MSKFTVYSDKQNEFRWKFFANDNNVIAKSSQGYKAKDDCEKAVTLLQKDITGATIVHEGASVAAPAVLAGTPASAASPAAVVASVTPRN